METTTRRAIEARNAMEQLCSLPGIDVRDRLRLAKMLLTLRREADAAEIVRKETLKKYAPDGEAYINPATHGREVALATEEYDAALAAPCTLDLQTIVLPLTPHVTPRIIADLDQFVQFTQKKDDKEE